MKLIRLNQVLLSAAIFSCAACSPKPSVEAVAEPAGAAAPTAPKSLTACQMVTAAEMSALLGGAVTAEEGHRATDLSACIYTAVTGISPYAELKIEWGSGEDAMTGVGMANAHEPGITDPLAGIGDQAVSVGTAVMIRRGEDLVTVTLSGVDDVVPHVKAIYELVNKRM